jgi:hypothetical protein
MNTGEEPMGLKLVVTALAAVAAIGLLAVPADAAPKKKRVVSAAGQTVSVTRGEDGRTRTRIIIQKRSYLDPGTEPLPSERNVLDYINTPTQRADSPVNNTTFGDRGTLPGPFTLPSRHNPWLEF